MLKENVRRVLKSQSVSTVPEKGTLEVQSLVLTLLVKLLFSKYFKVILVTLNLPRFS